MKTVKFKKKTKIRCKFTFCILNVQCIYILHVICNVEAGEEVISHVTILECTPKHKFK